jgi:hypothetical protein
MEITVKKTADGQQIKNKGIIKGGRYDYKEHRRNYDYQLGQSTIGTIQND